MDAGVLIFLIAFGVIVVPCILCAWNAVRERKSRALRVHHSIRSAHDQRNHYSRYGPMTNGRQRVREWELPPGTGPLRPSELPIARATLHRFERRAWTPRGGRPEVIPEDDDRTEAPEALQAERPGEQGPNSSGSANHNDQPQA